MAVWPYSTARWQRLRALKLSRNPLCEYCPANETAVATEVDHVTPINQGGSPWDLANLKSACKPCHSIKTNLVDTGKRERVPHRGVDPATGLPRDANHWWHQRG